MRVSHFPLICVKTTFKSQNFINYFWNILEIKKNIIIRLGVSNWLPNKFQMWLRKAVHFVINTAIIIIDTFEKSVNASNYKFHLKRNWNSAHFSNLLFIMLSTFRHLAAIRRNPINAFNKGIL